ncbi:MAG TPA: class D beta-lactamase [Rhodothermales bacterium]|nr:class D beta-lactamase [Rhodothermales bacterium]
MLSEVNPPLFMYVPLVKPPESSATLASRVPSNSVRTFRPVHPPLLITLLIVCLSGELLGQDVVHADAGVRRVLGEQEAAWNRGDIEAFMEGYWKSDSLRFASGGDVQKGWQATLDRYHTAYPDRAAMGTLSFTVYSVDVLSDNDAFVFGRYALERTGDRSTGLFTLLFRHFDDGWKIVFDHTSVDTSPSESIEEWTIDGQFARAFEQAGVEGTFVLHRLSSNEFRTNDRDRAETRFPPASTFKIFSALVALETGVIPDEKTTFRWDSVERRVPAWNRDHDLSSAIGASAVWYFQELARRIGPVRMQQWIDAVGYGNQDISGEPDAFWLTGSLRISPLEQIRFLERLYANDIPFSQRSMDIVKRILILEETSEYTLRGKTGWGDVGDRGVGWFVGYLERRNDVWIFANYITIVEDEDARHRVGITREILGLTAGE